MNGEGDNISIMIRIISGLQCIFIAFTRLLHPRFSKLESDFGTRLANGQKGNHHHHQVGNLENKVSKIYGFYTRGAVIPLLYREVCVCARACTFLAAGKYPDRECNSSNAFSRAASPLPPSGSRNLTVSSPSSAALGRLNPQRRPP